MDKKLQKIIGVVCFLFSPILNIMIIPVTMIPAYILGSIITQIQCKGEADLACGLGLMIFGLIILNPLITLTISIFFLLTVWNNLQSKTKKLVILALIIYHLLVVAGFILYTRYDEQRMKQFNQTQIQQTQ